MRPRGVGGRVWAVMAAFAVVGCADPETPPAVPAGPAAATLEAPPHHVYTDVGRRLRIDAADVPCAVVVRAPAHGKLARQDSVWVYDPEPGYRGTDAFACAQDATAGDAAVVGITVGRYSVPAVAETDPVAIAGDNADDIAIWVHPVDPTRSVIFGTNNARRGQGALLRYDLSGREIGAIPGKRFNNVDVRHGVPFGDRRIDVVAATNRTDDSIVVYEVQPDGVPVPLHPTAAGLEVHFDDRRTNKIGVYGFCLYLSPDNGALYGFVTCKTGVVGQFAIEPAAGGRQATLRRVREFDVNPGRGDGTGDRLYIEGCVADDAHRALYVAEEDHAIWRYRAEPDGGTERRLVDRTGPEGFLVDGGDVEGLAIYPTSELGGYLIASNQGDDAFNVYRRDGDNRFLTRFEIVDGEHADGVIDTDGIDVLGLDLGAPFTEGIFLAQDYDNDLPGSRGPQNFKMVRWADIARGIEPNLEIRTDLSPRDGLAVSRDTEDAGTKR